ncbi:8945_t:CDS:2, partial [Racocetra persica]
GNQRDPQIVNSQIYVDVDSDYTMQQQSTFNGQQMQPIVDNSGEQINLICDDIKNQNFINSHDYIPPKKRRIQAIQEASNNLTSQHNIYLQVANKNLEEYRSKMKHQMHKKYNIHECVYEAGDLVKIQVAKIDHGPGDHCALPCK